MKSDESITMTEITVLKQITDASVKQKALMKLMNSDTILLLKDKYHRTLPLKIKSFEEPGLFFCRGAVKLNFDFSHSETFTAHFQLDTEKYMFETKPVVKDGQIVLDLKRLFHLQSRQMARYKVPDNVHLKFLISALNEESCLLDCAVSDLNSHGCSLVVSSPKIALRQKDLIDATLINGDEGSIQLQGIIRNVRPHGTDQFAVGIEFHHMLYSGEDKLTSMITELHQKAHLKSS